MLTFPAWDREEGGLHFGTVHLACSVIACNTFYGFLSRDRAGKDASIPKKFSLQESITFMSLIRLPQRALCIDIQSVWHFGSGDSHTTLFHNSGVETEEREAVEELIQPISALTAAVLFRGNLVTTRHPGNYEMWIPTEERLLQVTPRAKLARRGVSPKGGDRQGPKTLTRGRSRAAKKKRFWACYPSQRGMP
jgi:hypothetical protein